MRTQHSLKSLMLVQLLLQITHLSLLHLLLLLLLFVPSASPVSLPPPSNGAVTPSPLSIILEPHTSIREYSTPQSFGQIDNDRNSNMDVIHSVLLLGPVPAGPHEAPRYLTTKPPSPLSPVWGNTLKTPKNIRANPVPIRSKLR